MVVPPTTSVVPTYNDLAKAPPPEEVNAPPLLDDDASVELSVLRLLITERAPAEVRVIREVPRVALTSVTGADVVYQSNAPPLKLCRLELLAPNPYVLPTSV